jgi:hypothetical protein
MTLPLRCLLGYLPEYHGLDWSIPGPAGARHRVVLVGEPGGNVAELFVDGVKRISGYRGQPEYRYSRGLQFGAGRYRSQRGSGVIPEDHPRECVRRCTRSGEACARAVVSGRLSDPVSVPFPDSDTSPFPPSCVERTRKVWQPGEGTDPVPDRLTIGVT